MGGTILHTPQKRRVVNISVSLGVPELSSSGNLVVCSLKECHLAEVGVKERGRPTPPLPRPRARHLCRVSDVFGATW